MWWCVFLVPIIAGTIGVWSLDRTNVNASTGYGLISAVPLLALLMIAVIVVSFVTVVARAPHRQGLLYSHLVAVVVLLYGAAPLAEHEGRLATSYYLAGFADHIADTGHVILHADARWSWPGMMSAVAALLGPSGLHTALPLLLWAPVVFVLAYSLPLLAIGRAIAPPRVTWVGVMFFYLANWTGQEYFSPQAVGLFLFLALLAITLTYLRRTDRLHLPLPRSGHTDHAAGSGPRRWLAAVRSRLGRLGGWLRAAARTEPGATQTSAGQLAALLAVWTIATAALTVAHQITPIVLVVDLLGLAVVGRLLRYELAILVCAVVAVYVSYQTADFWAGHLSTLLGFGGGGDAISQNVGNHLTGSKAHGYVLLLRIGFTAAFWLAGFIGMLRLLRRRRINVSLILLGWLPLIVPVIQPYGGEALIRAFLLGLPFTATMVAFAFLPADRAGPKTWIALGLAMVILIPVFFVNRYGNEQFEAVRPGELSAVRYLYNHAPSGSTLMVADEVVPWQYTDLTSYNYAPVDSNGIPTVKQVVDSVRKAGTPHTYLLLTTSQEDYAAINLGAPDGWTDKLTAKLLARDDFHLLLRNDDAVVLEYQPPGGITHG